MGRLIRDRRAFATGPEKYAMSWDPSLKTVRDLLAELYPLDIDARRMIDDAGLPATKINFGTSQATWHSVLTEANRRGQLTELFELCIADSGSPDLKAEFISYQDKARRPLDKKLDVPRSRRWWWLILIPLGIVIAVLMIFLPRTQPTPSADLSISEVEDKQTLSVLQSDLRPYQNDAASMQSNDSSLRFVLEPIEHIVQEPTSQFTWVLSTSMSNDIVARAYRMAGNQTQVLAVKPLGNGALEIEVPDCRKGDKLIAAVRVIWRNPLPLREPEREYDDIHQIIRSISKR
jgi:hypothetical protein